VHVLGTVEAARAARSDTIVAKGLNSLLLERLIRVEVIEVEGAEVVNGTAVGELGLRTDWAGSS
jgi:hypothetical protein